ncbi:MAG TPA: amidohydrolase [Microscillaceae bacterium]|jgi:hippurate hydrolase|nr:amidohydrolase [Microscillaceae bacterium]
MRHFFLFLLLAGISTLGLPAFAQNQAQFDQINQIIDKEYSQWETFYQYLHANPEISFQEVKTAATLAKELKALGFSLTENFGGTNFVAVLQNGEGPKVMIRADMDALPVEEQTGLPYASKVKTRDDAGNEVSAMHACGHDIHMTVLVATSKVLVQMKDQWKGTLVLIGQSAEERSGGAKAMIAEGLYAKFGKPDYALALHTSASLAAGKVGYVEGFALANVDAVDITVYGRGGHGAYPHTTIDPIVLAARMILDFQTIVSREIAPTEPAVVTVGSIHGGTKHNIIPNEVHLQLTLRSYSEEVRNQTLEALRRITKYVALSAGLPEDKIPKVEVTQEFTPATYNDVTLARRVSKVFKNIIGEANVVKTEAVMGGEDFGRFGRTEEKVPICIFWLGGVDPQKLEESLHNGTPLPSLHSAFFAPLPEPTLKTGVRTMAAAALDLFQQP